VQFEALYYHERLHAASILPDLFCGSLRDNHWLILTETPVPRCWVHFALGSNLCKASAVWKRVVNCSLSL